MFLKAGNMENRKNTNRFWQGALCGALAMFLVGALAFGAMKLTGVRIPAGVSESGMDSETAEKVNQLKSLIDEYYLYSDEIGEEELKEGIYSGYIGALGDPYSVYYDEEETKELYESTSGEYSGIGVVFSQNMNTKVITAVQVYENSPAEESGVQVDDILYKVDGEDVSSEDLSEVVQMIRGEEGTTVELTVLRGEDAEEVVLDIERRTIEVKTVVSEMKENQIGYIQITEFDSVTYDQFVEAFQELENQEMSGLVVDLRANPGGSLMTVSNILDLLLPEGTIVYTEDKNGKQEVLTSDEEHQFTKPIAVLVDGNSASASEIFAGAIQDYELGPIVGTTTYGKGIVQQIIDLDDDTCVKLTIAEYFTPNGRNIHKKGIEPDVEVEYEKDEENPEADNQLEVALEEVRKQLGE